jgi:hypothetical protein
MFVMYRLKEGVTLDQDKGQTAAAADRRMTMPASQELCSCICGR